MKTGMNHRRQSSPSIWCTFLRTPTLKPFLSGPETNTGAEKASGEKGKIISDVKSNDCYKFRNTSKWHYNLLYYFQHVKESVWSFSMTIITPIVYNRIIQYLWVYSKSHLTKLYSIHSQFYHLPKFTTLSNNNLLKLLIHNMWQQLKNNKWW